MVGRGKTREEEVSWRVVRKKGRSGGTGRAELAPRASRGARRA